MEKEEYTVMFNIEDHYWWYVGLRELILSFIDDFNNRKKNSQILDAGCGTGKILENCKAYKIYGIDFSEEAIKYCKLRKLDKVVKGSICRLPFKNESFDLVISLDVLYHKDVEDDVQTLKELYHVMNKEGILLLNLPAYNFLRSRHDQVFHTRRRYTVKDLRAKVEAAGFEIQKITYRNTFLFPIAFAKRIMERIVPVDPDKAESDLKPLPRVLNGILAQFLFLENKLIRFGLRFPFGLSIYCIAKKPSSN